MSDNMTPKTVLLQGEPGSGKSLMAGLTAIHKPVHIVDIDRKIKSAGWAQPALTSGALTTWELSEPYNEINLKSRIGQLVSNSKPSSQPKGWSMFAEYMYSLPTTPEGKAAGTWVIDSLTLLNEHLKAHIMFLAGRGKYSWDQWNALKIGWLDTISYLRDSAKEHGKDLIFTVHERAGEIPGDRTSGVKYSTDAAGNRVREVIGTQDLRVWASIDGATGQLIGATMDEYYLLYLDVESKVPTWKCRVRPAGRRNLRTSFIVKQDEFEPDFREIWK